MTDRIEPVHEKPRLRSARHALRATLDAELKRTGGKPSKVVAAWWRELVELYHAHRAEGACHPPVADGDTSVRNDGTINVADQG